VPAQGTKTFLLKEDFLNIHFFWENECNGYIFYINEQNEAIIDDLEYYLQSHDLEYFILDNKNDDVLIKAQELSKQKEFTRITRENNRFNYVGIIIRVGKSQKFSKEIELRKTKLLWIARDGKKFNQLDGTAVYNPYTPVLLDLDSIHKKLLKKRKLKLEKQDENHE
jgi:hypothetical protein